MRVDVISNVEKACKDDFLNKTVIVIDVLRATSTMITALANGSTNIIPVETVREAWGLKKSDEIMGGERYCQRIAGFQLGNSPLEYLEPTIKGKTIILTTTNGSRAIRKSLQAAHILAGAMLNASSCAQLALEFQKDIVIVCAGTRGKFSLEDGLCAGLIVCEMMKIDQQSLQLNDFGYAMLYAHQYRKHQMSETLLHCANGRKLSKLGFREDVLFCSRVNLFSTVPIMQDQSLWPFPSSKTWTPSYN